MSENGRRIIEGLQDAYRIANCQHAHVLPFSERERTVWHCPDCGGRFNQEPGSVPAKSGDDGI